MLEYYFRTGSIQTTASPTTIAPSTTSGPTPCNAAVTSTGPVTSPNYPGYDNDLTCSTIITAGTGQVVSLHFLEFDVESDGSCSYDSVSVYDGSSDDSYLIGRYCGQYVPEYVFSTGQTMLLVFESDNSVTHDGFSAAVDFVSGIN